MHVSIATVTLYRGVLGLTWADVVVAAPYLLYALFLLALCAVVWLATRGALRRHRVLEADLRRARARLEAREAELRRIYDQHLAARPAAPVTRPFPPDRASSPAARSTPRSTPRAAPQAPLLAPSSAAQHGLPRGVTGIQGRAAAPTVPLYPTPLGVQPALPSALPPCPQQVQQSQQRARLQVNDTLAAQGIGQGSANEQWTDPQGQSTGQNTGEMRWHTWDDEPEGHPAPLESARQRAERHRLRAQAERAQQTAGLNTEEQMRAASEAVARQYEERLEERQQREQQRRRSVQ